MSRGWAVLILALALSACTHSPTAPEIVRVPVPVPCPAPPATIRPALPLADLDPTSPPATVLRAYAASIELLMGYADELERILLGYRPAPAPTPAPPPAPTPAPTP